MSQEVNLNTASEKELAGLPGIGRVTAKKLIAGRPYSSVNQLRRMGLSGNANQKISPLTTVTSETESTHLQQQIETGYHAVESQ